jgi:hypothetical protein
MKMIKALFIVRILPVSRDCDGSGDRGSDSEGELLVSEVAEGGGEDGDDCSGEVGRGAVGEGEAEEELSEDRKRDEFGQHADAVDGEAAEPLAEVVAVGAKYEVFIAEEGHGDADGFGGDGGGHDGEVEKAVGQEAGVKEDEAGVEGVGEDGVPNANDEVADDLCRGQDAAQAGEGAVGSGRGGCGRWRGEGRGGGHRVGCLVLGLATWCSVWLLELDTLCSSVPCGGT